MGDPCTSILYLNFQFQSQAKFSVEMAQQALTWIEAVLGQPLDNLPDGAAGLSDQADFGAALKDGRVLCNLINAIHPGAVKKVNTMNAPFKQRENIEMYLKGCEAYGLKTQDLFQVNDLYESKNLYMVVDNLFSLGGLVSLIFCFNNYIYAVKMFPRAWQHSGTSTLCGLIPN